MMEAGLAVSLALLFFAAGAVKLLAPRRTRYDADRWRVPFWFVMAIGVVELVLAAGLLWPTSRSAAAGALAIIMVGAIGMQVRVRAPKEMIHPTITLGLLVWLMVLA